MKRKSTLAVFGLILLGLLLLGLTLSIVITANGRQLNREFHEAVRVNDLSKAEKLLRKGVDPKEPENLHNFMQTWRHGPKEAHSMSDSLIGGNYDAVRFLLDHGVDVDSCDGRESNLKLAAAFGWDETVSLLLSRGAQVDYPGQTNNGTALHSAAYDGNDSIARMLLDAGADPNSQTIYGSTPLHLAAEGKQPRQMSSNVANIAWNPGNHHGEVISLLLSSGADPEIQDNKGKTPVDIALENGRTDLHELLTKALRRYN